MMDRYMISSLRFLKFLICLCITEATRDDIGNVIADLKNRKNDPEVPPFWDDSEDLHVNVSFSLQSVINLESISQVLSVQGDLELTWKDPRMAWNLSELANVSFVEVHSHKVWTPKLVIKNGVDLSPLNSSYPLVLFHTGLYRWTINRVFQSRCVMNFLFYPFDTQTCCIVISSVSGFNITLTFDRVEESGQAGSGEWNVKRIEEDVEFLGLCSSSAISNKRVSEPVGNDGRTIAISIQLQRYSPFYFWNILLPVAILSCLYPFVYLIPARSSEKLGYLMSIFVSHSMYLNFIHERIPPSVEVSVLSIIVSVLEVQGAFTILATILVICIHHRKEVADRIRNRKLLIETQPCAETDVKDVTKQKSKSRCSNFSWERFLDGVFFVLSLIGTCFGVYECITAYIES